MTALFAFAAIAAWITLALALYLAAYLAVCLAKLFRRAPHDTEADCAERAVSLDGFTVVNRVHGERDNSI